MPYEIHRSTRTSRIGVPLTILGTAVLGSLPWWADSSTLRLFVEFACMLAYAQMWNLLAGYAGLVSVGQQAYFGIGGYALFGLAETAHVPPFLCVPLSGLIAALIAVPTSRVVFRLHGGYFAIGTWVVAEVFRLAIANVSVVGGGSGTSLTVMGDIARSTREWTTYWLALALAAGSIALLYGLLRSRFGLALFAIRDNERAAASQGVDIGSTKLRIYLVTAFGCGVAGALYFLMNLRISPDAAFGVNWTAYAIFIVVIGGIGSIEGPIVGAVIFFALRETLADFGTGYLIVLGALAVVTMLRFPQGLWGWLADRFDLNVFPVRRRISKSD